MNKWLRGYTFQRKKAASAANNRVVLAAAVFVTAKSVGFRSPALVDAALYKTGKHGD